MSEKTKGMPHSDETARQKMEADTEIDETVDDIDRQTSEKSGKHSSVEKLAGSRPGMAGSPGDHPVAGAFGDPGKEDDPTLENTEAHRDKALRPKP